MLNASYFSWFPVLKYQFLKFLSHFLCEIISNPHPPLFLTQQIRFLLLQIDVWFRASLAAQSWLRLLLEGGPRGVPPGNGGKLNPTRVSWICPEVSSLLAVPEGGNRREPVCHGVTRPLCFSARKTHFSRLHLDLIVIAANLQGWCSETIPRQTRPKLKALGHGDCQIPLVYQSWWWAK